MRDNCPYYKTFCQKQCQVTILVPYGFCNIYQKHQRDEKEMDSAVRQVLGENKLERNLTSNKMNANRRLKL